MTESKYSEALVIKLTNDLEATKKEIEAVRREAYFAIEKAKEERMEELRAEADLNGYSRGRADAQEEIDELEAKIEAANKILEKGFLHFSNTDLKQLRSILLIPRKENLSEKFIKGCVTPLKEPEENTPP
jgi:flagellar biosynthesis/type III secretory pathway protein FliH